MSRSALMWLWCTATLTAQSAISVGDVCRDQVAAVIGDHVITMADVERQWKSHDIASFTRLQQQLYEASNTALDGVISNVLLSQEAKRRGTTSEQLLDELGAGIPPPSQQEIKDVYGRSAASKQGLTLDQASSSIEAYLRHQKAVEVREQLLKDLKTRTAIDVRLRFDPPRQAITVLQTDPVEGPAAAPIEIVEFSDFECPYCRQAAPTLKQVIARHSGGVRLIWKDYPLPIHPSAAGAAEAAQCAHDQGKFWQYHDLLFSNQHALKAADLRRYASDIALDVAAFERCVESAKYRDRVSQAMQQGRNSGVSATPTVFINGRIVTGAVPIETYEKIIGEELAAAEAHACTSGICVNPAVRKD